MGSYKRPKHSYTSEELDELQRAFDSVWALVQSRYPSRDKAKDETLKGSLRRKLFTLGGMGIRDDEALAALLLNSIPQSYGVTTPARGKFASRWRNRRI
jgi:hypothetical protein